MSPNADDIYTFDILEAARRVSAEWEATAAALQDAIERGERLATAAEHVLNYELAWVPELRAALDAWRAGLHAEMGGDR